MIGLSLALYSYVLLFSVIVFPESTRSMAKLRGLLARPPDAQYNSFHIHPLTRFSKPSSDSEMRIGPGLRFGFLHPLAGGKELLIQLHKQCSAVPWDTLC